MTKPTSPVANPWCTVVHAIPAGTPTRALCGATRPLVKPQGWLWLHEWDTHIPGQSPRCPECDLIAAPVGGPR